MDTAAGESYQVKAQIHYSFSLSLGVFFHLICQLPTHSQQCCEWPRKLPLIK